MESFRLLAAVVIATISVSAVFYALMAACWMWTSKPFPNSDLVGMGIVVLMAILGVFAWDFLPKNGGNRG